MSTADIDYRSKEWREIKAHLIERKAALVGGLSKPMITERDADMLRGAIREINTMLRFDDAKAEPMSSQNLY